MNPKYAAFAGVVAALICLPFAALAQDQGTPDTLTIAAAAISLSGDYADPFSLSISTLTESAEMDISILASSGAADLPSEKMNNIIARAARAPQKNPRLISLVAFIFISFQRSGIYMCNYCAMLPRGQLVDLL